MTSNKKVFSKIGVNYIILEILAIIFQIILINIIALINPECLNDINVVSILSSICCYILPFPIFYWLMKKIDSTELEKTNIDFKTFLIYLGITITLMWIGNIIGLIITAFLSGAMQSEIANPVQQLINSSDILFNILVISVLAPIFEEIIFRKLLIDRTIKYGAKISIILSALLFALFHGNLNQFFYALFMGGFFAYVYIKTGKITYTIILHGIINFMGSVASVIFAEAVMNLQSGINTVDLSIIIGYMLFVFIFLLIGIYGLSKFKKARFNGSKTQIALKNPYKSIFLNIGMVLFILFFIVEIVRQVLG